MANLVVNNKNYTKTGNINVGKPFGTIPFITTDRGVGDQSITLPLYGDEVSKIEIEFSHRINNDYGYIFRSGNNFYLQVDEEGRYYFVIKNCETCQFNLLNENLNRYMIDFKNSQLTNIIKNYSYPLRHSANYGFTHDSIVLFTTVTAATGEIKFYNLEEEIAMHLVPKKNFETGFSYYLDLVSGQEYYPNVPWNYFEYSEESILYIWNKPKPIFTETKISSVNATNIELFEDYHNFDFIKIKLSNVNYSDAYSDILCTPSSLDKMLTISHNNRVCLTYSGPTNQYIMLYKTDNTHFTFGSGRGAQFYEMYGVNCSNYNIDITDIYTATGPSSSNINISLKGIDLSEFDYLNLGGNSGSSDEQVPGWYLVDTKAAIYEGRYEYLLIYGGWQHIIIHPNFITPARYGVIEGIKLLPKTNI